MGKFRSAEINTISSEETLLNVTNGRNEREIRPREPATGTRFIENATQKLPNARFDVHCTRNRGLQVVRIDSRSIKASATFLRLYG